jgi:enoyl-CoA hydratase/carnithine racemase
MFRHWSDVRLIQKPIIAAVNGFCLGGGCELAMMCDVILAGEKAKFGQPEINLGIIPGAGGTQRLVHAVGKSMAMQLVLTGEMMDAATAERKGLCSQVYPVDELVPAAVEMATAIAAKSRMAVLAAKEAVNVAASGTPLETGLQLERRLFHALFATHDQKEGMQAFLEKRKPGFQHK